MKAYAHCFLNALLCSFQENYCTQPALLRFLKNCRKAQDSGNTARAVFMDLSKAFDCLNHDLTKTKIHKSQQESKCRMCGDSNESINHILNECKMLAQKDYKKRHDWVGRRINWEVCRKCNIDVSEKWYNREPVSVLDNGQ